MGEEVWKKFYEENLPPHGFADVKAQISDFCNYHNAKKTPVVLITVSLISVVFTF